MIKNDAAFAAAYARQDLQRYIAICEAMRDVFGTYEEVAIT